jgi:hypothetical protein
MVRGNWRYTRQRGSPALHFTLNHHSNITLFWIAAIVIVFLGAIRNTGGDYFWVTFLLSAIIWLSFYLVLRRFGLLALVVGLVVQNILVVFPMTTHLNRWYASGAIAGMVTIGAIALFAVYNALAGQPLFSTKVLDD